ncbi:MAG: 5'/3'-nucleotidase SurE [Eubacteriales bacterium]|nr:5'/3'-nucleotidase SurE [Eubacteriales bacterium]
MKILLTNEAGCFHPSIVALAKELCKDHRVCIVAPLTKQVGSGHSLTVDQRPLHAQQWFVLDNIKMWSVDGTPCDCVALALDKLLLDKPDLIISGIDFENNHGNMIYTSGVVSAAVEGAIQGIKSIALSAAITEEKKERAYRHVAKYMRRKLEFLAKSIPDYGVLNVNFPEKVKPKLVMPAPLTDGILDNEYEIEVNPFGSTFAWMKNSLHEFGVDAFEQKGDLYWLKQGYITLTPLKLDLLKGEALEGLQKAGIKL